VRLERDRAEAEVARLYAETGVQCERGRTPPPDAPGEAGFVPVPFSGTGPEAGAVGAIGAIGAIATSPGTGVGRGVAPRPPFSPLPY